MKMLELRKELREMGFSPRRGRGSHETWIDPEQPHRRVVLAGNDGEEAHKYQVARVRKFQRGMMIYE